MKFNPQPEGFSLVRDYAFRSLKSCPPPLGGPYCPAVIRYFNWWLLLCSAASAASAASLRGYLRHNPGSGTGQKQNEETEAGGKAKQKLEG